MREKVGLNDDDVKRLFSKNVRFEVTDVSTRLQGCPSRVSSFRFLPLVREEAGALHVGQAHRRVIQDRLLRHQVAFSQVSILKPTPSSCMSDAQNETLEPFQLHDPTQAGPVPTVNDKPLARRMVDSSPINSSWTRHPCARLPDCPGIPSSSFIRRGLPSPSSSVTLTAMPPRSPGRP